MRKAHKLFSVFLIFAYALALNIPASAEEWSPPEGFELLLSDEGVQVYKKEYPEGNPDFVQVINLAQRAGVRFFQAPIVEPRIGKGAYGGDDPRFESMFMEQFWAQLDKSQENLFCLTNGAFFYMPEYPTRLAFPLKVNGEYITDGFGYNTYPGQKLMLELWGNRAQISSFSSSHFYNSTAPDIIVGLREDANKRAKYAVGRTFVGIADIDGDFIYEVLLIYNTKTATQEMAAEVLRDFGADKVMMLDGGGSTQLMCSGEHLIESERPLPQVIGVFAALDPPVNADWQTEANNFSTPLETPVRIVVHLENTGINPWKPEETKIVFEVSKWAGKKTIVLSDVIQPGESLPVALQLTPPGFPGDYVLQLMWYLQYQGEKYWMQPLELNVLVYEETKTPGQGQPVKTETHGIEIDDIPTQAINSTDGEESSSLERNNTILIIPAVTIPVGVILLFVAIKMRRSTIQED